MIGRGDIKPRFELVATDEELALARKECADRVREGSISLAASYECGEQDAGWAVRFAVDKLRAERGDRPFGGL